VGHDRAVTGAVCDVDCIERLAERADLIDFDEDRVGATFGNASAQELGVRDKQVIANDLNLGTKQSGHRLPTSPITFGESIFNRSNRPASAPFFPHANHFVAADDALGIALEEAVTFLAACGRLVGQFTRRRIEANENLSTEVVSSRINRACDEFERFLVCLEIRGKSALVSDGGRKPTIVQNTLERVINLNTRAQSIAKIAEAPRLNHELLEVEGVVGMLATVEDVEHRRWKCSRMRSTNISIERLFRSNRRGMRDGKTHSKRRIGAEMRLVFGSINLAEQLIDALLRSCVSTHELRRDERVDVLNGFGHTLAEPHFLITVAQLNGLMFARRCATWNCGSTDRATRESHFAFDCWLTAGIQNLTRFDVFNGEWHHSRIVLTGDGLDGRKWTTCREPVCKGFLRDICDMPFRHGVISYARCAVGSGTIPTDVDRSVLEKLNKNVIRPDACGNGSPATSGWIAGRHVFDLDFSHDSNGFSAALLAAMRTDTVAVPPALKRAYRALIEDELRGGARGDRGLSRAERMEAKEQSEQRCMQEIGEGRWRKITERPVLWDLQGGVILAPVEGEVPYNQLKGLMQETFGCLIERQSAGRRAVLEAAKLGHARDLQDARLDAFVSPPATIATDEEGAPRKIGEHPEPAWAAADPLDYFGNVFLLWLWWKCDCAEGLIEIGASAAEKTEVALVAERVVDLDCAWGVTGAISLRGDAPTRSPEAARALLSGKMPRRIGLTLAVEGQQWRCTVQGDRLTVSGLSLPKPQDRPPSEREAIEQRIDSVLLFERALLGLYQAFLAERLGGQWKSQRTSISEWIRDRAAGRVVQRVATARS